MATLRDLVNEAFSQAFVAEGVDAAFGRAVPSNRPELGDFQCNGAMAAAKALRAKPQDIAQRIVARLGENALFTEVTVAGPGFINVRVADTVIADIADQAVRDTRVGVPATPTPQTIVLDFGGPNVAKALHVGHLRSAVIGESLRRILAFSGHRTISDMHIGDWGTPMGMLIDAFARAHPELHSTEEQALATSEKIRNALTLGDLQQLYPKASAACKADPERAEAARKATLELQSGRPAYRQLWRAMVDTSMAAVLEEFGRLGSHFDLVLGESDAHPYIGPMLQDLKTRGLAHESEGALVVAVATEADKSPMPPLIIEKADGAALYATTDLGTIVMREQQYQPQRIFYVVDQRQALQLEQVFRAAKLAGYDKGAELVHVPFGTVNGPDNKPFKTRDGGVMRLADLLDMTTAAAAEKIAASDRVTTTAEEGARLAEVIGVGALKFADLSSNRVSGYIFDPERMTAFEGKTGPYLQYAAVRAKSVIAKAGGVPEAHITITAPEERELLLTCLAFPEAFRAAEALLEPSAIADAIYAVAQAFSRFYAACPIACEDQALRSSRLQMTLLVQRIIGLGLELLGIEVPGVM